MRESSLFLTRHVWSNYVFGSWNDIIQNLGPAIPMYFLLSLLILKLIFGAPLKLLKKQFPVLRKYLSIKGDKVFCEEGFDNYFSTIDKQHIRWSYLEEKRCRQ